MSKVAKLLNVVADAALRTGRLNFPVQTVEILTTIDNKNNPKEGKKPWQGYLVLFNETDNGKPGKAFINASVLLQQQEDEGATWFDVDEDDGGLTLSRLEFGLKDGVPYFEE